MTSHPRVKLVLLSLGPFLAVSCQGPQERPLSARTTESRAAGLPIRVELTEFGTDWTGLIDLAEGPESAPKLGAGSPLRKEFWTDPGAVVKGSSGTLLPVDKLRTTPNATRQEKSNWCWAACAQMIYKFNKVDVSQEEIVKRIKGDGTANDPATYHEVLFALNPDLQGAETWVDQLMEALAQQQESDVTVNLDAVYKAYLPRLVNSSDWIVEAIRAGEPLVLGMGPPPNDPNGVGHCYAVYGVDYRVREFEFLDHFGKASQDILNACFESDYGLKLTKDFELVQVLTVNPWDGTKKAFSAEEFNRDVVFVISKPIARAILENERRLLDVKPTGTVQENALFKDPEKLFNLKSPKIAGAHVKP